MDLTSLLSDALGTQINQKTQQEFGLKDSLAKTAVQTAVPLLLKALQKNASNPKGAESLQRALNKKHNGDLFNHFDDFINNRDYSDGMGILGHVLGNKQTSIVELFSKTNGLSKKKSQGILAMLAPVVMGALGKQQQPTTSSHELAGLLGNMLGNSGSSQKSLVLFEQLLDQDGDGEVADDVLRLGGRFLGRFLKNNCNRF